MSSKRYTYGSDVDEPVDNDSIRELEDSFEHTAKVGAIVIAIAVIVALFCYSQRSDAAVSSTTLTKWSLYVAGTPLKTASGATVLFDTYALCDARRKELGTASTKVTGETAYRCQDVLTYRYKANPVTCPALPAARTQMCPTGTVGSWTQTPTMSPAPACVVSWSPALAPIGACTTPPPAETFTACGDERGTCAGTGFKRVCYSSTVDLCVDSIATNDRKLETTLPVACNNDRFSGDPMPGVVKRCFVSDVVLTPPPPEPGAGVASLSWTRPTMNTDGTPAEIAGYAIYYGTSTDQLTRTITIPSASTVSYVVGDLSRGTWYFAVRATSTRGAESTNSNIVSKVIE